MVRSSREGQFRSRHRMNAPSSTSVDEHLGHCVGIVTGVLVGSGSSNGVPSACFLPLKSDSCAVPKTSVIFGMTSPLLTTLTRSPSIIPSLSTSPLLCSVVLSTVTPDTVTGATLDTGVTLPVLPVCHSTSIKTLIASSGGNFQARAQRG